MSWDWRSQSMISFWLRMKRVIRLILRGRGAGRELGVDVRCDISEADEAAPRGCASDLLYGEAPGWLAVMFAFAGPSAAR